MCGSLMRSRNEMESRDLAVKERKKYSDFQVDKMAGTERSHGWGAFAFFL